MTTDDERRMIARKLRDIDAERLDRVYGMDGESGTCEDPWMSQAGRGLMLGAIAEAVGLRFAPYYFDAVQLRDRLASLVEPAPKRSEATPKCDREALLVLADAMASDGKIQRERQKAGEHWFIDGADIVEYARRIRQACGVDE